MGKLKFKVHPLFILFGIYFAFTGKVFSFIVYTLSAVIHELGHSISAQKSGYRLVNMTLMPFGAVIKGEVSQMSYLDEIRVALAGPLVNFLVGAMLVALWWAYPECYPYTELAVTASFALCVINLIPAFPLDGGRVVFCSICLFAKRKVAIIICRILGCVFAICFFALFIYSCYVGVNYTLLFFGLFILFGAFEKSDGDRYVRIYQSLSPEFLKGCKAVKTLAVNERVTVRQILRKIDGGYLYRVLVFDDCGKLSKILEPDEVVAVLQRKGVYERLI